MVGFHGLRVRQWRRLWSSESVVWWSWYSLPSLHLRILLLLLRILRIPGLLVLFVGLDLELAVCALGGNLVLE